MNTHFTYMYRDGSNWKECHTVILKGELKFTDIEPYLFEGENFIPGDVGLPELQARMRVFPNEDDHVWHETRPDFLEWNSDPPGKLTVKELIARFKRAHAKGWQEDAAVTRLGIP